MEMDSGISISDYFSQYGGLKFHDSQTFTVKLSPILLNLKNNKKRKFPPQPPKKKKKKSGSSIEEITKETFEAVDKTQNRRMIKSSSWVKTRLLGQGSYGSVYLATNKNDKTERAIKSSKLSHTSTLMDEGRILTRLQSPFVIRCYGDEITREGTGDPQYNLILEYCSGKSVADLIIDNSRALSEFDVKIMAKDILFGLRDIHNNNIIHCDIKPDNLLLSPVDLRLRRNGYLTKIGDFGLAVEKGSKKYGSGFGHKRGTTIYMAPELITLGIVDFSVDIWAFGCTILEMLTGKQVWCEHGDNLDFDDWLDIIGYSGLIPDIPSCLSAEAQDFLEKCLVREPDSRWGIESLINHPFLN